MKVAPTKRLSHGERTRREILDAAVILGAAEGLESLTIGRLAAAVEMSKGGLFAHFGSKEALQLATVEHARDQFVEEVAAPALAVPPGVAQLEAFLGGYFDYLERRRDRGGCSFTAASLEFDDRPGAVRTALRELMQQRELLIHGALKAAAKQGEISADEDLDQLVFEVMALSLGANVSGQLLRAEDTLARARRTLERRLDEVAVKKSRGRETRAPRVERPTRARRP